MDIPKVLAIDYGTVRVGIAVSAGTLADPLEILANDAHLFENIVKLCKEHEVSLLLVGISENEMAEKTKEFVAELEKHMQLPVRFMDETLSSHSVHEKLVSAKKSKREGNIDHFAAAEFLQIWLDENY